MKNLRRIITFLMVVALLLCCIPSVFAATSLTYQEYLKLSTEEQIAYRATFSSNAEFRKWYIAAKNAYEDAQDKITIGDGNSVDISDLINPPLGSGNCGENLSWKLSNDNVLTITGTGAMYDYTAETLPWGEHVGSIRKIVLPDGISSIGAFAFTGCSNVTGISIPASVTVIGNHAFAECSGLNNVIYAARASVSATSSAAAWNKISIGAGNEALTGSDITYAGEVRISAATLALEHNISVLYKVKKATVATYGFSDLKLVIDFNGTSTTLTEYTEDGEDYVFRFRNIAPNQTNDTQTATLYATRNGATYVSASREYSVATYCYTQLDRYNTEAYAEFRTLLVDLLNYGAAAQAYTNYRTDALVNKELTAAQAAWGTATVPSLRDYTNTKYATVEDPAVKWKGATLVLQDAVTMRYKIQANNIEGLTAKFTCEGNTWYIPASQFKPADTSDTYYIYFNGLNAGQMRSLVYVTIYDGDTAVSNTVQYSIESYASGKTTNVELSGIVTAMMLYGDSAYNFAN